MAGLAAAFGSGAMTNSIAEIGKSKTILITGTNTTENHPVIGSMIKRVVSGGGTNLIVVDPRGIEIIDFANIHLIQRPGTDVAWINGMMNVIIEEKLYDEEFVRERTEGFLDMKEMVKKYTPEYVEKLTTIPAQKLISAARLFAGEKPAAIYYAMGITQHTTGTDNVLSLANLAMLTGNMGIEGGGVNPLRGQNNVQGACDLGGLPNVYPAYQKVIDEAVKEKFTKVWKPVSPLSDKVGLTVMEMMDAAYNGELKALYIMGENPMLSDPDLSHAEKSLKKLDLLVVQDIFMTETARLADVVLPGVTFAEKDGTFTNTERRIQRVRAAIPPIPNTRQDWEIIAGLSTRMGYPMSYKDAEEIFEELRTVTPSYAGVTYDRIEEVGVQWPCPTEDHPGIKFLHKDKFVRGLGLFSAVEFKEAAELPDKDYPLILTTGRVRPQYHTGTMTRRSAGLEYLSPDAFVEINPKDASKNGVTDGDIVKITSRRGEVDVKAWVTDRAPVGTIFMPFHYVESAANILTNTAVDPVGKIPEYKVCAVNLKKKRAKKVG